MTILLTCLVAGTAVLLWPVRKGPAGRSTLRTPGGPGASLPRAWRHRFRPLASGSRDTPGGEEVADSLVLIALGLRAGLPLIDALRQVRGAADGPGVAGRPRGRAVGAGSAEDELAAVVAALHWGRSTREAWAFAGPRWHAAATASQLSEQTGAAAADLLEQAATRLREQRERSRERAAARAGVLLVLPLGLGFLPAFACTAVVPVVATLAAGVLGGPP